MTLGRGRRNLCAPPDAGGAGVVVVAVGFVVAVAGGSYAGQVPGGIEVVQLRMNMVPRVVFGEVIGQCQPSAHIAPAEGGCNTANLPRPLHDTVEHGDDLLAGAIAQTPGRVAEFAPGLASYFEGHFAITPFGATWNPSGVSVPFNTTSASSLNR